MIEARPYRRRGKSFSFPNCIYCGGNAPHEEVDHNPARIIFDGKLRPQDWEFPSCAACNRGTKHAELVAGMMSRAYGGDEGDAALADFVEILRAIESNIPGLLRSLEVPRAAEKLRMKTLQVPDGGGPIAWNSWLHSYMEVFAAKIGFAGHFLHYGHPVPESGGVITRLISNIEPSDGLVAKVVEELFPSRFSLRQGRWSVEDQFTYCVRGAEDGEMGATFATFRSSFALIAFSAAAATMLEKPTMMRGTIFRPGDLQTGVSRRFAASTGFRVRIVPPSFA